MTSDPAHIAIVGCGFTATSALHQLVSHTPVRAITVFESSGQFVPGYAYDPNECSDYLINNTTDTMCLGPENKRAFLDWLETRQRLMLILIRRDIFHVQFLVYFCRTLLKALAKLL